jgi:hypothetical protein
MKRVWGVVIACAGIAACADILGIDDGVPRTYDDASIEDASLPETTSIPDATPPPTDAGIDVPVSALACGDASCNALTEACCRTGVVTDASVQSFACVSDASACKNGLVVTCDDSTNCAALGHPGEACCAEVPDGASMATKTSCVPANACTGMIMCQAGDDEICDVDAGQSCLPSMQTIVGWTICKN